MTADKTVHTSGGPVNAFPPKHGMTCGYEGGPGSWVPHYGAEPSVSEFNPGPEKIAALREQAHEANEKAEGLHHKYDVKRVNDPTGKHAGCRYFVLDPQHDTLAREALGAYANAAAVAGYAQLAMDLNRWLGDLDA